MVEPGEARRLAVLSCIIVAAPLVLFLLNRDWLLTPEAWLDPWHYVGFFHEYWNPDYSAGAYKLARLPWILSGVLFNQFLPTLPAAYALHLTYLSAMALALFVGVHRLLGRPALAAVVALMLACYTPAHGSGGWDYHNTAAGAFYLATFMVLAGAGALAGRPLALGLAGVLAALAVHANITFVNFLPALLFVHLRTIHVRSGGLPSLSIVARRAAWGAAGALLVTALLGLINWFAGREFLFFRVLFDIVVRYVGDASLVAQWKKESAWYYSNVHLALLAAVFLAGVLTLFAGRRWPASDRRLPAALVMQFLGMSVIWAGWQAAGQLALDWDYFAYVLIPSCFIAIAGLMYPIWPEACERHWLPVTLGAAATLVLALGGGLEALMQAVDIDAYLGFLVPVAGAVFLAGFVGPYIRPGPAAAAVLVVAFALGNRIVTPGAADLYNPGDTCQTRPPIYEGVVDGASWLSDVDPSNLRVRAWFAQDETIDVTGDCRVSVELMARVVSTTAFVQYVTSAYPMPAVADIPPDALSAIVDNDLILAVLTGSEANIDAWDARLSSLGFVRHEVGRHRVQVLEAGLTMHAWTLTRALPEGITLGAPVLRMTDRTTLEANFYGAPKGRVESTASGTRFVPTDARDHAASPMQPLDPRPEPSWARLTVQSAGASGAGCRLILQSQDLNTITTAQCASVTKAFLIPQGTTAIRVVMLDQDREPIVIPRVVEVAAAAQ